MSLRTRMATPKNNRQQPVDSCVDDDAYGAARYGTLSYLRLRPTSAPRKQPVRCARSQSDDGYGFARRDASSATRIINRLNSRPLWHSGSRAAPGQLRRRAVRSWLDPLSRGPAHPERKLTLSGISILWLRCKSGWRSRQYGEGLLEGSPSVPEVGLPLDTGSLRERSFRSNRSWGWSGLDQADCRFCTTRRAWLSLPTATYVRFFLLHRRARD